MTFRSFYDFFDLRQGLFLVHEVSGGEIVVSSGVYIVYVKGPGIDSIKKVAIIK